jgi:glutathione synthase/RimK-type ligase-like ATP-grasp enzyme
MAIEAITGVWHYLPGPSKVDHELDEVARLLIQQEARETLQGLAGALADRRWINLPHRVRAAQHKLFQLQLAAQVGFQTPKSLVTNQPAQAVRFLQACGGQMVYKPQHSFLQFNADGSPTGGVFVTLVARQQLDAYLDSIAIAPCLFQEVVPKQQEVTAYVIGPHVFAAVVRSPTEAEDGAVDHRVYGLENCHYTPTLLPSAVENMCLAMTRQLGLRMCNFDLIHTPAGEYVFLDANPTEQWTFVEYITEFPLGAAIVDELLGVATVTEHPYLCERSLAFTARAG